jgi:signal transduction histidine kinase
MTWGRAPPTVRAVKLPVDLPMRPLAPQRAPVLRAWGMVALAVIVVSIFSAEPHPSLQSADGRWVALGLAILATGVALSLPRRQLRPGRRFLGLALVGVAAIVLELAQPHGAGFAAVYYVMAISGLRLEPRPALIVAGGTLAGVLVAIAFTSDDPWANGATLVFATVPWFLVTRLLRSLADRHGEARELVEELRESRAAHAQSAALAERGRVAREMHDVLAHSLSALALQLEGTRLLARDRGADPEVVAGLERAHHLAATGLAEARQAIAALRGDALPGPERLRELAEAFGDATLTVTGEPRELSSEERLALYRTAQEALTNVRRHSEAERVEIRLSYDEDGTSLVVQDHGPGAPVAVGAGGGYGLTGMRERAELLGGRLSAEPTDDGFRVELWLPSR